MGNGETIRSYTNRLMICVDEWSKMCKFLMSDQDDQNLSNTVPDIPESPSPPVSQLKHVTWHCYIDTRKTGNKVDVYYYPDGSNDRLRSLDNLTKYCQKQYLFRPRSNKFFI